MACDEPESKKSFSFILRKNNKNFIPNNKQWFEWKQCHTQTERHIQSALKQKRGPAGERATTQRLINSHLLLLAMTFLDANRKTYQRNNPTTIIRKNILHFIALLWPKQPMCVSVVPLLNRLMLIACMREQVAQPKSSTQLAPVVTQSNCYCWL